MIAPPPPVVTVLLPLKLSVPIEAEGARVPSVNRAAERLGGILDDTQVKIPCDGQHALDIDRVSECVHRHDRTDRRGRSRG